MRIPKGFRVGAPLIVLVVGGQLFLSSFVDGKLEQQDRNKRNLTSKEFDLEKEHKKALEALTDKSATDTTRIPRPPGLN